MGKHRKKIDEEQALEVTSDVETPDESTKETSSSSQELNQTESHISLSALEEDLLTALLGQELYGLQLCQAIQDSSEGRQVLKIGSLYPSLHRLERKGFVISRMEDKGSGTRGGNRRKYYRITGIGARALTHKQDMRKRLAGWKPAHA